jgi:hypothetical protein
MLAILRDYFYSFAQPISKKATTIFKNMDLPVYMHAWIQQINGSGVFGVRTELLSPSMVHRDEGSCLAVFLTAWTPLTFILTIFCSSFFVGEVVHLGR